MRPKVFDAFMFAGSPTELLLLECRLTELYDTVDAFILVEGTTDHQGHPKPLYYQEYADRYKAWSDKITYVVAEDLPTVEEDGWCWAREHAQREWIGLGLYDLEAEMLDVVLQSDLDEIPRPLHVRNTLPAGMTAVSFHQRGHFWAIDWDYPTGWNGTVAMRVGAVPELARGRTCGPFTAMRDKRNANIIKLPDAGWHFSWLGSPEDAARKIGSFCHPEVVEDMEKHGFDYYYRAGFHMDNVKMNPVDVDSTWPIWMQNPENVPANWYRPR